MNLLDLIEYVCVCACVIELIVKFELCKTNKKQIY